MNIIILMALETFHEGPLVVFPDIILPVFLLTLSCGWATEEMPFNILSSYSLVNKIGDTSKLFYVFFVMDSSSPANAN